MIKLMCRLVLYMFGAVITFCFLVLLIGSLV